MSDYAELLVPDMDQWNADQVLAVYDLCQIISANLMHRYEDQLIEKMMEIDERCARVNQHTQTERQLSFGDPF